MILIPMASLGAALEPPAIRMVVAIAHHTGADLDAVEYRNALCHFLPLTGPLSSRRRAQSSINTIEWNRT